MSDDEGSEARLNSEILASEKHDFDDDEGIEEDADEDN